MRYTPDDLGKFITECVDHSMKNLNQAKYREDLDVYTWPQMWGSTACGFGGIGGATITTAQTVVIIGPKGDACIYHGSFAYKVERPSKKFVECMSSRQLPGKADKRDFLEMEKNEEI